jgi:hypothetical protein
MPAGLAVFSPAPPFPATNSFSAALIAAVSALSAKARAFSSFTSFSSWSMRLLSASSSCATVGCSSGLGAVEDVLSGCPPPAGVAGVAAAGGSTLAVKLASGVADCAKHTQVIPTAKAVSVMAFRRSAFIFTSRIQ